MPGQRWSSSSNGDTGTDAAAPANNGATSINRWISHGHMLTACIIAINFAIVVLIYLYFWRLFFRKRSTRDEEEDASSSASTPPALSPMRNQDQQQEELARLVASLPTFVVGDGAKQGAAAEECAVCIAELRDGDEARALPRCGHRFHAACVDAWLRRHTTCPLCRASVVIASGTAAGPKGGGGGGVTDTTASAVEDMDAPV